MNLYSSKTYMADIEKAVESVVDMSSLNGSSVLITGASGLIGSFLVDMLVTYNKKTAAGIKVYATGRSISRLEERFSGISDDSLVFVQHDVNSIPDFDFDVDFGSKKRRRRIFGF